MTHEKEMERRQRLRAAAERGVAGFGLIEVIVAMVVLAIGVLSISNVLTQSVAMQTISSQRASQLSIAQTAMEQVRAMEPTTVVAVAEEAVDENGNPDANGIYTREITVTDVSGNIIEVTVIVGAPRSEPVRIVTQIYDGAT